MRRLKIAMATALVAVCAWSCGTDVVMQPEKALQKAQKLAAQGSVSEACGICDALISQYCEYAPAYAVKAAAEASEGNVVAAAADMASALRRGVTEADEACLGTMDASLAQALAAELKNECTVYQTAGIMYALGRSYECTGALKDAYNAYCVAAQMDETYAQDVERVAAAKDQEGATDSEYFTRDDGCFNLRVTDRYMGYPAPASAAEDEARDSMVAAVVAAAPAPDFGTLSYPALAKKRGIEGDVKARVSIGRDGGVRSVRIIDGVHFTLDSETVRVLEAYDRWGEISQGNAVVLTIPVSWRL